MKTVRGSKLVIEWEMRFGGWTRAWIGEYEEWVVSENDGGSLVMLGFCMSLLWYMVFSLSRRNWRGSRTVWCSSLAMKKYVVTCWCEWWVADTDEKWRWGTAYNRLRAAADLWREWVWSGSGLQGQLQAVGFELVMRLVVIVNCWCSNEEDEAGDCINCGQFIVQLRKWMGFRQKGSEWWRCSSQQQWKRMVLLLSGNWV